MRRARAGMRSLRIAVSDIKDATAVAFFAYF